MRSTTGRFLWKGQSKVVQPTRQAKQHPFWDTVKFTAAMVASAFAVTGGLYGGRRMYFSYRGDGNVLWVEETVRDYMREHPKLAVAVLHMTAHHALCASQNPFGAPMVSPPELSDEAEEILAFLKTIQKKQPSVALADLWVLASGYSLSGLGGPMCHLKWGNRSASLEELAIVPSLVSENESDVVQIKKALVAQGYPLQEIAALMGYRTVGYHRDQRGLPAGNPAKRKCTKDELVFDNEYFINLLERQWTPHAVNVSAPGSGGSFWGGKKSESITVFTCEEEPDVTMRPLDLSILSDPLLKGWIIKYAENELKFFNAFAGVLDRIHMKGYVMGDIHG